MKFDCVIIGGGISGLTCGIRLAAEGLSCAVISAGMSALHFSSGSIDLMGFDETGATITRPLEYLESFVGSRPSHPYARCGVDTIREALLFFTDALKAEGLDVGGNGERNHFHITSLGTIKPTYLSQESVFNETFRAVPGSAMRVAVLNFEGYRDFYPEMAINNLKRLEDFRKVEFVTGRLVFPDYGDSERNPFEYRSIDIARIFDTEKYLPDLARQIKKAADGASVAGIPGFLGINNYKKHLAAIREMSGVGLYEIPTLPPSILGMRIDNALKSRFAALGGVFIAGDRVIGGPVSGGKLQCVYTKNNGSSPIEARDYVLSAGSFFSGGLTADSAAVSEPVFGLKTRHPSDRRDWRSEKFFSPATHPFLEFGVETDGLLRPALNSSGAPVENLYCTGAILSGYNPVREGSGSGVAISTGYRAAINILAERAG